MIFFFEPIVKLLGIQWYKCDFFSGGDAMIIIVRDKIVFDDIFFFIDLLFRSI